jgi:hypothetical protein
MRVMREWRHLKMLKRAGRGHDESGVAGTQQGKLAIDCPACPHPGINLPDNWESAPKELKYLYCLIVVIDACFRLKCRLVSGEAKNPGIDTGWAYFVDDLAYRAYLLTKTDQQEVSILESDMLVYTDYPF